MKLTNISIRRPVFATMVYIAVVILGFTGLSKLAIDFFPDLSFPVVIIMTQYSGVGPQEIETSITRVIESAVASAEGIEKLTAESKEGISVVSVQFRWGQDLDAAVADLRDKLDLIRDYIPRDATKPTIFRINTSNIPIMMLGLIGDKPIPYLYDLADQKLKDQIEQVKGVASMSIEGGTKKQVQVVLSRNRLDAYQLTPDQVINMLRAENINASGGTIKQGFTEFTVRTQGEFADLDEIRNVVLTFRRGVPVYLRYVAEVNWGISEETTTTRFNGVNGLRLPIRKQSGANTVEAVELLQKRLERIRKELPAGVTLIEAFNTADYIKKSISSTSSSAIQGGLLAILVVFFFLRNLRASLIIGIAIPMSVIATFIAMYFMDVSVNMISLGGLALGIGMLVDNAIVVLENIFSYLTKGQKPGESARLGAGEVGTAILSSTLTTVCVFLPIVFTAGFAREIFKEMALTVTFSLMASLLVALTLIPMLASKYLRMTDMKLMKKRRPRMAGVMAFSERAFERLENRYRNAIRWALEHRKTVIWGTVGFFLFTMIFILRGIDGEFMPETDEGMIRISLTMPAGTRLETTDAALAQLDKVLDETLAPEDVQLRFFLSGTPGGFASIFQSSGSSMATYQVRLVGRSERKVSTREYVMRLKEKTKDLPAPLGVGRLNFSTQGGGAMMGGGSPIDIIVRGFDLKKGAALAADIRNLMEKIPGLYNIDISRKDGIPEYVIRVNRIKAASLGLNMATVTAAIQQSVLGLAATRFREQGQEYDIFVRLDEKDRQTVEDIENIQVRSSFTGQPIRVGNIATIVRDVGPVSIQRDTQERAIHVTAATFGGLQQSVDQIKAAIDRELIIPPGFTLEYSGSFKDMQDTFGDLAIAVLVAILLVYAVMAAIFESFLDPFIIFFTIPLSLIGVFWALFLTGITLNVQSFIGILVLAGVVVNNGIVLVDYVNILRERGNMLKEALMEGGRRRLRPILMTTLTTVLALLPLGLGIGEGAEASQPMAVAVIGGLSLSMLLSLFFIPVIYSCFATLAARRRDKREARRLGVPYVPKPC